MQIAEALLRVPKALSGCGNLLGAGLGAHTATHCCALDHGLRAQPSQVPIWESCRARINQCLMCLFDTPSAGTKQVLVPDSKTKKHQHRACFGLPSSVLQGLLSAESGCRATDTGEESLTWISDLIEVLQQHRVMQCSTFLQKE